MADNSIYLRALHTPTKGEHNQNAYAPRPTGERLARRRAYREHPRKADRLDSLSTPLYSFDDK